MTNGIIIINKEAGMTSFGVVARLRRLFHEKKIGHTGTLDPDALGVLPICLGKATGVVPLLTEETKTYEAILRLGLVTDTQDTSGQVLSESPVLCTEEEVREAILSFEGPMDQIPPMYSALKVKGQKLCDLARQGIEVERKSRRVVFSDLVIHEISLPEVRFTVTCTKGAYIRTLCHDIGQKLGCGGCMAHLIRTRVGRFGIEEALTLGQVEEKLADGAKAEDLLMPADICFRDLPELTVAGEKQEKAIRNGNVLKRRETGLPDGQDCRIYDKEGRFAGIYRYKEKEAAFHVVKNFYDLS